MLEFDALTVWLPSAGEILEDIRVTCEPGQLWAVVGRSGSGSSALLQAAAGALPRGAQFTGTVRWHGGAPRRRDLLHIGDLPPMGVAEYLRGFTDDVPAEAATLGLDGHLGHRIGTLPPDLRVALRLAALRNSPSAPLVLFDGELTAATPKMRREVATELARRARDGAVVLWADHDLDTMWREASHILELDRGRLVRAEATEDWHSLTLPRPTLLTLARMLDLPDADSRRPETLRRILAPGQRPSQRAQRTSHRPDATASVVDNAAVGLTGRHLELGSTESVGLIDLSGRPEPLARRIIEHLGGEAVSSHLPPAERRDRFVESRRPLWLPHPQTGLDAHQRHALAERLAGENPGPRLITSRDLEFLVRACRRIAIVDDGAVLTVGSPHAVARHLPELPMVAEALGSPQFLRLTDLPFEEDL